jgi:hypothetical protein
MKLEEVKSMLEDLNLYIDNIEISLTGIANSDDFDITAAKINAVKLSDPRELRNRRMMHGELEHR